MKTPQLQGPGVLQRKCLLGRACFAPHERKGGKHRAPHRILAAEPEDAVVEDKGKASDKDIAAAKESGVELYIGFDKSDTTPRKGRKGRVVQGNPEDYPDRNDFTGGWSGGEVGLQQFLKKYPAKAEQKSDNESAQPVKIIDVVEKDGKKEAKAITPDGEQIYIGYGKSEKRTGQPGSFVTDDPRRYPDKEDVGIFPSVTGGFAGGEVGVKEFVKSGTLKFDDTKKGEFSSVVLAGIVALGVSTGALLLNSGIVLTESAFEPSAPGSPTEDAQIQLPGLGSIPDNKVIISQDTKKLLNVALGIIGVSTVILGGRTVATRLQRSSVQLKEDAVNVGKISLFWVTVMIGVLYVVNY